MGGYSAVHSFRWPAAAVDGTANPLFIPYGNVVGDKKLYSYPSVNNTLPWIYTARAFC